MQLGAMSRLTKIMERRDGSGCFAGKRINASLLIQRELAKKDWSEASFLNHMASMSPEGAAANQKGLLWDYLVMGTIR